MLPNMPWATMPLEKLIYFIDGLRVGLRVGLRPGPGGRGVGLQDEYTSYPPADPAGHYPVL